MKKLISETILVSTLVLAAAACITFSACDTSCETEGEEKCSGASVEVCVNKEWDMTDCFVDKCEPEGWSSGTCVEEGTTAYCKCGD